MCRVNGVNLQATYNNETSLTCSVNMNDVSYSNLINSDPKDSFEFCTVNTFE